MPQPLKTRRRVSVFQSLDLEFDGKLALFGEVVQHGTIGQLNHDGIMGIVTGVQGCFNVSIELILPWPSHSAWDREFVAPR